MKRILLTFILSLAFSYISYSQNLPNKIASGSKSERLLIDSSLKIGKGAFYYRLLLKTSDSTFEIYKIINQDHSIEFNRKFFYQPLNYICYEIDDLPTGVTWNVLYNTISKQFYITDHYDLHAMGDMLLRKSVDFNSKSAKIMSFETKKSYKVKLIKLAYGRCFHRTT